MRWIRENRLWQATEGVAAIEFAFIAGALCLLILGLIDFGIGYWEQMQVDNAARAGAQYALKNGYDSARIQTVITNSTVLAGIQANPAPVSSCGCPNVNSGITTQVCNSVCVDTGYMAGTYVTANAQVSYQTIVPWPGISNPMTLMSSATVRIN